MDVAFEKRDWTIAHTAAEADHAHPDWRVLRARLQAARQAWHLLRLEKGASNGGRCGSFDRGSALCVGALASRMDRVNQKDSGNRNRGRDTYMALADLSSTGGRGWK